MKNKMLDEYYAKTKHSQDERKLFTSYMERQYKEYLKAYHDVKIKYRGHTEKKMTFKEFKATFKSDYLTNHDINETRKLMTTRENLLTLETPNVDRYFKIKEGNFNQNLKNIKERLKRGEPLDELENLMVQVDKERHQRKKDFMWAYNRLRKLGEEAGLIWQRSYDSPDEEIE